jgi:hypothetical protein
LLPVRSWLSFSTYQALPSLFISWLLLSTYQALPSLFEQEAIREKTLNLDGPLLEDATMLESLMTCQNNVQRNRIILEETRFMGDHLQVNFFIQFFFTYR